MLKYKSLTLKRYGRIVFTVLYCCYFYFFVIILWELLMLVKINYFFQHCTTRTIYNLRYNKPTQNFFLILSFLWGLLFFSLIYYFHIELFIFIFLSINTLYASDKYLHILFMY